jgi:hypothetical protein
VGEALRLLEHDIDPFMVTLVNVDDAFLPENLQQFNPSTAINRLRQQLRRGGVEGRIVGGLDGEYDGDRELYQPHFHLICLGSQVVKIQQVAARHYAGGGEIYRGCVAKPIKVNSADTIAYTIKGYWPKKTRYEGNRKRSAKRLDSNLHIAWLLWRSKFRLTEFSIFYGFRRYGCELAVIDKS